jgi:hypothetical protein
MSPLWLAPIECVIIAGGIVAVLLLNRTPQVPGRHRMDRKTMHAQELARVDEWLTAIRATSVPRHKVPVELVKPINHPA